MLDLSKSKLSKAKVKGKSRRWLRSSSYAAGRDTVLLNTNVQSTNAPIHQNKTKVRRKVTFFFKKRVFLLLLFMSTLALKPSPHVAHRSGAVGVNRDDADKSSGWRIHRAERHTERFLFVHCNEDSRKRDGFGLG